MKVVLADFGVGNLHSIRRALEAQGADVVVRADPVSLPFADVLVLPGVANFSRAAMGLAPVAEELRRRMDAGMPTLGVCAGMQLLFEASEEGPGLGVGYFRGKVRRLTGARVPHMGWDPVWFQPSPLFEGIPQGSEFYFAHSYAPEATCEAAIGVGKEPETFAAAVARGLTFGIQFHPEKSHRQGWRLLRNFLALAEEAP